MIRRSPGHRVLTAAGSALALLLGIGGAAPTSAQAEIAARPFGPGEVLSYRAVSARFGTIGSGTLRVDGPVEIRGGQTLQLAFDFRGRVGIFRVEDRTRSWVAVEGMRSLRYERRDRSPLGSHTEKVEIYPEEGRWEGADGATGETECAHPLDELSFLYYLRSLPLGDGEQYSLVHHFDAGRNPVMLRVVGREMTSVPAGEFATVVVEMRVRDERLATMRLHLTDDALRIPVRIESSASWLGSTRLLLVGVDGIGAVER